MSSREALAEAKMESIGAKSGLNTKPSNEKRRPKAMPEMTMPVSPHRPIRQR